MQEANWYSWAMCVQLDVASLQLIITLTRQEVTNVKNRPNCTTAISTTCTLTSQSQSAKTYAIFHVCVFMCDPAFSSQRSIKHVCMYVSVSSVEGLGVALQWLVTIPAVAKTSWHASVGTPVMPQL